VLVGREPSPYDVELWGSRLLAVAEVRRRAFGRGHPFAGDLPLPRRKVSALLGLRLRVPALWVYALGDGTLWAADVADILSAYSGQSPRPFTCDGAREGADVSWRVSLHVPPFFRLPVDWLEVYSTLHAVPFSPARANAGRPRYHGAAEGGGFA
jgi:hypothetical protein